MSGHKNNATPLTILKIFAVSLIIAVSAFILPAATGVNAADGDRLFTEYNPNSRIKVDYGPWTDVLELTVWATGRSDRLPARTVTARLGTRISAGSSRRPTRLEANRVFYHVLQDDQLEFISGYRRDLEGIPSQASLSRFSRNEQLAYWLNLYTVTVYEQIALEYPSSNLNGLRNPGGLWDQKLLNVEGHSLSLRDIETRVLTNFENPLVIYGLYQGTIGGPNIRTTAYSGEDVYEQLESNARDFVNSLRGLQFSGNTAKAAEFYNWQRAFFPNFESDLRDHLTQYAISSVRLRLQGTTRIEATVNDWYIADLYNGRFGIGASSDNPAEFVIGQDHGDPSGSGNPTTDFGNFKQSILGTYSPNPRGHATSGRLSQGLVAPETGFPEHVEAFIRDISIRNARMRDANVIIEEVDSDTTVVAPDDEGNN